MGQVTYLPASRYIGVGNLHTWLGGEVGHLPTWLWGRVGQMGHGPSCPSLCEHNNIRVKTLPSLTYVVGNNLIRQTYNKLTILCSILNNGIARKFYCQGVMYPHVLLNLQRAVLCDLKQLTTIVCLEYSARFSKSMASWHLILSGFGKRNKISTRNFCFWPRVPFGKVSEIACNTLLLFERIHHLYKKFFVCKI